MSRKKKVQPVWARPDRRRVTARQVALMRPSARELFSMLRARLLESRPVLEEPRKVTHRPARGQVIPRRGYNVQEVPAVFGAPTFRNVIEDGEHR